MTRRQSRQSFVRSILEGSPSRTAADRRLAEMALGILGSLENSAISFEQARLDLFNLDTYQELRRRRAHRALIEALEWAMELEDVQLIAPEALADSYRAMRKLLGKVLSPESRRRSRSKPRSRPSARSAAWTPF